MLMSGAWAFAAESFWRVKFWSNTVIFNLVNQWYSPTGNVREHGLTWYLTPHLFFMPVSWSDDLYLCFFIFSCFPDSSLHLQVLVSIQEHLHAW